MAKSKIVGTKLSLREQWHAAAWLRETGEYRPALDVLRGDQEITRQLRVTLADWIEDGSKRTRGAKIEKNPWEVIPPELGKSLRLAVTRKEQQALMLFLSFPSLNPMALEFRRRKSKRRGKPPTWKTVATEHVAHKLGVSTRTARAWWERFGPEGCYPYILEGKKDVLDP